MFKFKAGAHVRLTHSIEDLGLNTRMTGIVWALYRTVPKSYEVKFTDSDGKALDVIENHYVRIERGSRGCDVFEGVWRVEEGEPAGNWFEGRHGRAYPKKFHRQ